MKFLNNERIISSILIIAVCSLLVVSNTTKAFQISMQTDKSIYNPSEIVIFTSNAKIESGERIPINNVTLNITGNGNSFSCDLPFDQSYENKIITCGSQIINASLTLDSVDYEYGYLNADYESSYEWGYGYGYGYESGSAEMNYTIEWIVPSGWSSGEYTAKIIYDANSDLLVKQTVFDIGTVTTTTVSSYSGGGGTSGTTTTTSTTTTTLGCDYACQAICVNDTTSPLCYDKISHGTGGCSGGMICCESVDAECPVMETTTTTIPENKTSTNPITGLASLTANLWDIILRLLAGIGLI